MRLYGFRQDHFSWLAQSRTEEIHQIQRAVDVQEIMEEIDKTIKSKHKVIFTADFENPWITREGYIYREIFDITDPLLIFVEDKSRGSDYGD